MRHKAGEDKSGKKRKKDSFIHYYLCAGQQKAWRGCAQKNCASASKTENWALERLHDLATSEMLVQEALQAAQAHSRSDLQPVFERYQAVLEALHKVDTDIETMMETIRSGKAVGALWDMLNERAFRLKHERDELVAEQRRLKEQLAMVEATVDTAAFCAKRRDFDTVRKTMHPEEVQRLLRLLVQKVEWSPQKVNGRESSGQHRVHFFVPLKSERPVKNELPASSMSQQAVVSYCDTLRYPVGDSNP